MTNKAIDTDRFASTIGSILGNVNEAAAKATKTAVREGVKAGKAETKKNAPVRGGGYQKSWHHTVRGDEEHPEGYVYSDKPGLPHLLEKGHARMGGGRVAPRVHIAPAADIAFEETEKAIKLELERRISEI